MMATTFLTAGWPSGPKSPPELAVCASSLRRLTASSASARGAGHTAGSAMAKRTATDGEEPQAEPRSDCLTAVDCRTNSLSSLLTPTQAASAGTRSTPRIPSVRMSHTAGNATRAATAAGRRSPQAEPCTHRLAAVDCGTNALRLLLCETSRSLGWQPVELLRVTEPIRLGADVAESGRFSEASIKEVLTRLQRFRALGEQVGDSGPFVVTAVQMCATSACRRAGNAEELLTRAGHILGTQPQVISGEEEARLTFQGAISVLTHTQADVSNCPNGQQREAKRGEGGMPANGQGNVYQLPGSVIVVDVGGGSTEIAAGRLVGAVDASAANSDGDTRECNEICGSAPAPGFESRAKVQGQRVNAALPIRAHAHLLHSLSIEMGSRTLTSAFIKHDPPIETEMDALRDHVRGAMKGRHMGEMTLGKYGRIGEDAGGAVREEQGDKGVEPRAAEAAAAATETTATAPAACETVQDFRLDFRSKPSAHEQVGHAGNADVTRGANGSAADATRTGAAAGHADVIIGTGGVITTIAAVSLSTPYSRQAIHGTILEASSVKRVLELCLSLSRHDRLRLAGMWEGHADVVFAGCCIVLEMMETLACDRWIVSDSDLLDGMMDEMIQHLQEAQS